MNDCCAPKKDNGKAYDLAVIGAGSAGFSAAITAADEGARVALIGYGTIGEPASIPAACRRRP
jgi:mercuric reductase